MSFIAKGIYLHNPVHGLNLNRPSISGLEPEMPVTILYILRAVALLYYYSSAYSFIAGTRGIGNLIPLLVHLKMFGHNTLHHCLLGMILYCVI
jgi:hypothetical protein